MVNCILLADSCQTLSLGRVFVVASNILARYLLLADCLQALSLVAVFVVISFLLAVSLNSLPLIFSWICLPPPTKSHPFSTTWTSTLW